MSKFWQNKKILLICIIYFLISFIAFGILFHWQGIISYDSPEYVDCAVNLIQQHSFSADGLTPNFSRTPGYPIFLAAIYALGGNNTLVTIIQILLATLEIYLFYRILLLAGTPPKYALTGAALLLFNITSYQYSWNIAPDFFFGFLLMLAFYFLANYLYSGNKLRYFSLFAFILNYALLVRPILIYFNILIIAVILFFWLSKKISGKGLLVFVLCFVLAYGGWSYRNYRHSGVFIFSTIQNYNMQKYYAPIITAELEQISENTAATKHDQIFAQQYPQTVGKSGLNNVQVSLLQKKYGLNFIKAHLPQYLKLSISGLFSMMLAPSKSFVFEITPNKLLAYAVSGLYILYLGIVYILYLGGLVCNYKKIGNTIQMYVLLLSGYLAATSAIMSHSRFRVPFFALLLLGTIMNSPAVLKTVNSLCRKYGNVRIPFLNNNQPD